MNFPREVWAGSHLTRKQQLKRQIVHNREEFATFLQRFNNKMNCYTSVYDYNTGKRPNNNVYVDRETVGTNVFSGTGYQQYVTQRLINENKSITNLYGGVLRNVQPQLAHKQGAFVDFASYKAQTESYSPNSTRTSVYIPNNNISHVTHASPSIQNTSYSGVIVEKTNNGFAVRGYDISRSHFKTTVSDTAGINVPISVGGVPSRVGAYVPNQTLEKDQLVRYEGNYYRTVVPHVTDTSFVAKNFVTVNEIPTEGGIGATYYKSTKANTTVVVPYGTEFKTSQESQSLVSVIMNCFNGEKYLREAIDSVLAQTYQNWELIFWDNQSTDKSAEIVKSYEDPRIYYFYARHHTLLYEARNYAIEQSNILNPITNNTAITIPVGAAIYLALNTNYKIEANNELKNIIDSLR